MKTQYPRARQRLSVAMIVRNADDALAATLHSIRAIADEIVVVDTGNSYRTQNIAGQLATRVLVQAWQDDFSAARNFAWDHVTGDWVLWLDAGEQLSFADAQRLRAFVDCHADSDVAYRLTVAIPPAARDLSAEQVERIRLVPNRSDVRFVGRVREELRPALMLAEIKVETCDCTIARTAREHLTEVKIAKAQRDLKLANLEILEDGPDARLLIAEGEGFATLNEIEKAADCFRRAILSADRGATAMIEGYYGLLTTFDSTPARRETQIAICLEALEIFPLDAQLLCAMGSYLQAQGQIELAIRSYQTAVQVGQIIPDAWHLSGIREVAVVCHCLALQMQQRDDEARTVLEMALREPSTSSRIVRNLMDLHIKHNRRQEALELVDRLQGLGQQRDLLRATVRGACLAMKQNWVAALAYLQTAYASGCRDLLCLRWLAISLISTDEWDRAEPILHQWQQRDPRSVEARQYLDSVAARLQSTRLSDEPAPAASRAMRIDAPAAAPLSGAPLAMHDPLGGIVFNPMQTY